MFTIVKNGIFTFVNMENEVTQQNFFEKYPQFKNKQIGGRFLSFSEIEPELEKLKPHLKIKEVGKSFLNVPILSVRVGNGPIKILAWSQMHGNETTTTKGLFDLFNLFISGKDKPQVKEILERCTLLIIPILNPDGAARYTRENVNKVDLNRDAQDLKEPESIVLRKIFEEFEPHFCLNLHDQRTIFGVGKDAKPATLSFLAPSMDAERTITPVRTKAMQVIAAMNDRLQKVIPGQVGRFDDSFNINCTGDTFQSLEVPTILFECGHLQEDYQREETRKFFIFALFVALDAIATGKFLNYKVDDYKQIPENQKIFYDVILREALIAGQKVDVAIQFVEKMKSGEIFFEPVVQTMAPTLSHFGHQEIWCDGQEVKSVLGEQLRANDVVHRILLNNEKLSIKTRQNQ